MKRCSKCKVEKPVSEFWKHRDRKDGYTPACKDCVTAYKQSVAARTDTLLFCPKHHVKLQCKDSRRHTDFHHRDWRCPKCKFRFYTVEITRERHEILLTAEQELARLRELLTQ